MTLSDRLSAFIALGEFLRSMPEEERIWVAEKARKENGWFTEDAVALAFRGIEVMLEPAHLQMWAHSYPLHDVQPKTIGVAMAGNIPLVGFHDLLCVLMAGHHLLYKPSSKDTVLMEFIQKKLIEIEPRFTDRIARTERLNGADAVIATGSDNSSRYFEYYFRNVPHILRKNRVSCAVIQGDEAAGELNFLGGDIFSYYGLGCRNVSCLFVPREYELQSFIAGLGNFSQVLDNHKYENNYTYRKSLLMLNQESFYDNGFLLLKESDQLISPVSMLHYMVYEDQADLKRRLSMDANKLQVIVSARGWYDGSLPFGQAQFPRVHEYADGVDTMRFLTTLK